MAKYLLALVCVLLLTVGGGFGNNRTTDPIGVAVSPQNLILGSDQGGSVVVHTAVPYSIVDTSSLTLNGVPCCSAGADACGRLVASFPEEEVKAIVAPPSAILTLEGLTKDGDAFSGSDTVSVMDVRNP